MKILRSCFLLLSAVVLFAGCMSNEKKIEKYKKVADEFIANPEENNVKYIWAIVIDTETHKLFYKDTNGRVMVYDLATKEAKHIFPDNECIGNESGIKEEFVFQIIPEEMSQYQYIDTGGFYNGRLFLTGWEMDYRENEHAGQPLFYVDVNDDSFHYVATINKVSLTDRKGVLNIYRGKWERDSEGCMEELVSRNYDLRMDMTDEEYAADRRCQDVEDERIIRDFRQRLEERRRAEERRREESQNMVSWLYGSWKLSTGGFRFELDITEDNLRWRARQAGAFYADELWNGSYTLYMNRIEINGTTAFYIDMDEKRIYTPKGEAFYRRPNY